VGDEAIRHSVTSESKLDKLRAGTRWLEREARTAIRQWRRSRVAGRRQRSRQTYVLATSLLLLIGFFAWTMVYLAPQSDGVRLTLGQATTLAAQHRLSSAVFLDQDAQIVGRFTCAAGAAQSARTVPSASPFVPPGGAPSPLCTGSSQLFRLSYPRSDSATSLLLQLFTDGGAAVTIDAQTIKADMRVVETVVLPLMILANMFVLLFAANRGKSSGVGEVELFGSIGKGRFGRRKNTPITFTDVAGADEAVEELKEVRDYLADPDRYKLIGAQPPKGVLLIGPPGCGKTLLAKAVAGEVGVPFFSVAGAEFVESLVGVGAARVRDLFARVRAAAPAVVFIDELDAAGRKRATGGGGGNEEREQTLNQILVEMDGFDVSAGVVIMGATNRPDILDPALLRPGRFDRHVTVDRPDVAGRAKILELHARGKPIEPDVDFLETARRTPGFSGADLANVVNEAALLAIRQGKVEIGPGEVDEAVQRTVQGSVRRTRTLTAEERKRIAYHEGAHVVVAAATGRFEEVHRVSILGRGRDLGMTTLRGDEEAAIVTRSGLHNRLTIHLAGTAAEELVFGELSTGSEQDLVLATSLARDMVARYGMSTKLGTVRLLAPDVDEFLDADVPFAAVSGMTHQDIDAEIRRLVDEAKRDATRLLVTHRTTLDALAARLETEETLDGPDLEVLLTAVQPAMEMFGYLADRNGRQPVAATGAKGNR
jgi:cell division protease FtsH